MLKDILIGIIILAVIIWLLFSFNIISGVVKVRQPEPQQNPPAITY